MCERGGADLASCITVEQPGKVGGAAVPYRLSGRLARRCADGGRKRRRDSKAGVGRRPPAVEFASEKNRFGRGGVEPKARGVFSEISAGLIVIIRGNWP